MKDRNLRVLVVEDDQASRKLLAKLVEQSGYECIEACDGREGLAKIQGLLPDIVITDWLMPEMNGIELVRAVRAAQDCHQPYIVLTTAAEDEDRLAVAFQAGVDDFIDKPLRKRIVIARLKAAQRIVRLQRDNAEQLGELQHCSEALNRSNLRIRQLAMTDELTGIPNRRYALDRVQREWLMRKGHESPLTCMIVDLDGLKQINDIHGHERGDVLLKTVAAIIKTAVQPQDVVCRIGGDEFLVICPGSSIAAVMNCGERLINAVGTFKIHTEGCPFGIGIGVAERRPGVADPQEWVNIAYRSMYHAKRHGKNQIYSAQEKELRAVLGLSDVCHLCKTTGRRAKGQNCLWRSPEIELREEFAVAIA